MSYKELHKRRNNPKDDFYTKFEDINNQLIKLDFSRYTRILLPCDDENSNFVEFVKLRSPHSDITYDNKDFNKYDFTNYDLILTNPPFSKNKEFITKLVESGTDFVIVSPLTALKFYGEKLLNREIRVFFEINDFILPDGSHKRANAYFISNIKSLFKHQRVFKLTNLQNENIKYERDDATNIIALRRTNELNYNLVGKQFYMPISALSKDTGLPLKFIHISRKVKVNGLQKFERVLAKWEKGDK